LLIVDKKVFEDGRIENIFFTLVDSEKLISRLRANQAAHTAPEVLPERNQIYIFDSSL